jgi:regulator of replication initiation timing
MGLGKPRATLEEAPAPNAEEDSSSESDEVEVVATPKKRKAPFRPFQAGPSRTTALAVPEGGASKLEEEVEHLRVENARMRDELGEVEEMKKALARLQEENAGLRASNARYHDFCVDTRQHARSQHAELLTVSNKFYTFSSQWRDAEREMTDFLAREEKLINQ